MNETDDVDPIDMFTSGCLTASITYSVTAGIGYLIGEKILPGSGPGFAMSAILLQANKREIMQFYRLDMAAKKFTEPVIGVLDDLSELRYQ